MINLKVLSSAAVVALVLPMAAPSASFAQNPSGSKANFAVGGAGGGGFRAGGGGGAPAAQIWGGGGGFRSGAGCAPPTEVATLNITPKNIWRNEASSGGCGARPAAGVVVRGRGRMF